jgi:hypothetical protein
LSLAEELLRREIEPFKFLFTRNLQQDPLEQFFSRIRRNGGLNDNPTVVQAKFIIRKLIIMKVGGVTPSLCGNCSIRETITAELLADEDFKNGAIAYMAGYVVRKIDKRVLCNQCKLALQNSSEDPLNEKCLENLSHVRCITSKLSSWFCNKIY